jgi:phage-related protein
MKDIGDGVREITIQATGEAYRVIYVASLGDRVYVLHAFHKKAKKGIATPAKEIDIARNRYRDLCQELASRVTAPRSKQ